MKLNLKENQKVFICSDPHSFHKNIVGAKISNWKSGYRNFDSIEEMNEVLVKNINDKVGQDDILFCLGDWAFGNIYNVGAFRKRLNVRTIHLLLGNHDKHIRNNTDGVQGYFTSVHEYLEVHINGITYVLFHYPIASYHHKGHNNVVHLWGHCHGKTIDVEGKNMDVGFDGNPNFEPYEISEILRILKVGSK